jgi:hypothetical protein
MPQPTATIDRAQRDGLYELIRNHLGAIGDIWIALEKDEEYMLAERLGLEFGEDFCLLADIGWDPDDRRQSFELTMEAHDLMEALRRLHGEAEHVLAGSRTEREAAAEDARTNQRFQAGREACEALLSALDPRAGERR